MPCQCWFVVPGWLLFRLPVLNLTPSISTLNKFLYRVLRFGQKAENYDLVIAAARHYWNAIKPFIVEPIDRELLREPMEAVLECIAAVAANEVGKEDEVKHIINRPYWYSGY